MLLPLNQSIRSPRAKEAEQYRNLNAWQRRLLQFSMMLLLGVALWHQLQQQLDYYAVVLEYEDFLQSSPSVFTPRVVQDTMHTTTTTAFKDDGGNEWEIIKQPRAAFFRRCARASNNTALSRRAGHCHQTAASAGWLPASNRNPAYYMSNKSLAIVTSLFRSILSDDNLGYSIVRRELASEQGARWMADRKKPPPVRLIDSFGATAALLRCGHTQYY